MLFSVPSLSPSSSLGSGMAGGLLLLVDSDDLVRTSVG